MRDTSATITTHRRRRPTIAALLSLLWPGLGHFYAGRPDVGNYLILVSAVVTFSTRLIDNFVVPSVWPAIYLLLVAVAYPIYAIITAVHAFRCARLGIVVRSPLINSTRIAAVTILIAYVGYAVTLRALVLQQPSSIPRAPISWAPYTMVVDTMSPTIRVSERVVAATNYYALNTRPFEYGDIIVCRGQTNPEREYIRRIVGLPGDRIRIASGHVFINGIEQPSSPIVTSDGNQQQLHILRETLPNGRQHEFTEPNEAPAGTELPELAVPDGRVFVLRDNRQADQSAAAVDGTGLVMKYNVTGKVTMIYWSDEFSRIGRSLD